MIDDLDTQMATLKELVANKQASAEPGAAKSAVLSPEDRLNQRKVPYTVAVTSGKGGVGKTVATVNLALNFAKHGLKVLLIDADLGLANIDVVLGLSPEHTIQDVLSGEMSLDEVAVEGPEGITVLPAASGVAELSNLDETQRLALMDHIDRWNTDFDVVLVDTGAGISPNVRFFVLAVERIMVVATPDPASVTDAYALMKVMFLNHRVTNFDLLVNQVQSREEALDVYRTLNKVLEQFLNIGLNFVGFIPQDPQLGQATRKQQAVTQLFPEAPASKAFAGLAGRLLKSWVHNRHDDGRLTFFWRKLLDDSGTTPNS
ncbi:MAG: MinD/ParA family protein [Magnetococcales bacterium]|nr:MinD/ParA family protein [Magnetococcales bacterium]